MAPSDQSIDLTGNWHESGGFLAAIQTREPELHEAVCSFRQVLDLAPGSYTLELFYDQSFDREPGRSLGNHLERFEGLHINGRVMPLAFQPAETGALLHCECEIDEWLNAAGQISVFTARCDFYAEANPVTLELSLDNTRPMRTILHIHTTQKKEPRFAAIPPQDSGELVLAHGIPFLMRRLHAVHYVAYHGALKQRERWDLREWEDESAGIHLDCGGASVQTAYFLCMIHSIDVANGSWYSPKGDNGYSHFSGDTAGEIQIRWQDGGQTRVPLIFGYNLWYSRPWDLLWYDAPSAPGAGALNHDATLFSGDDSFRDILEESLALFDGVRLMGSRSCNARFIFSLDLQNREVRSIDILGAPGMHGHPLIAAVTLETASSPACLAPLPTLSAEEARIQPVHLDSILSQSYLPNLEKVKRMLYTFLEDLPALETPAIPRGYFGPTYDFRGTQEAVYDATYLYTNGPECAAYIADQGTGCSSSTARRSTFQYTLGIGIWCDTNPLFNGIEAWLRAYQEHAPGSLPGLGNAWTRGVGELLREAVAFGYDKFVDSYIDWLDDCLFREANPPHWNRIAGYPAFAYQSRKVGNTLEQGNRENDGHGICMWGRALVWHAFGRPREWNERHFAATQAAVEWIQWQLDSDMLFPGTRKDVLYTESECAHGDYDIYSSYNCLHGIKLSIRMAEQLGRSDLVGRWQALYRRLRQGILAYLVDETPEGPIWHTYADTDWQDHAHKLAPIHLAADGDTYTPLQAGAEDAIEQRFLEISRSTYRTLMKGKNYNCLRMYGYGQGMMTQAALLLDEMTDAAHFLDELLTHCYLPRLEGWASPEGIIVHPSGKFYVPVNGYMGQDSHAADSTKALRLMLGIDDNDPQHLRLVPRFPAAWKQLSIAQFPVLTGAQRQHLSYTYQRSDQGQTFQVEFEHPLPNFDVRLGPLPSAAVVSHVSYNQAEVQYELQQSGDSSWIWLCGLSGAAGAGAIQVDFA
jgi:hypothetical protein